MSELYVIGYDIGTTAAKTCLYRVGRGARSIVQVGRAVHAYPLHLMADGGAEQDPDDWWRAMAAGTRQVLAAGHLDPARVRAISFSGQMQALVLVDGDGRPVRRAMSYMDSRGTAQHRRGLHAGPRLLGMRARLLIPSLIITGGVSASVKDPVWKYRWVLENEPDVFARARHWLDVKDYVAMRCTGRASMTEDSANVTFLFDTRRGQRGWSPLLCRLYGVTQAHLPEVIGATDTVGPLTAEAAQELGLAVGTAVIAGGGDVTMVALGAGCVRPGDTVVYSGTSGWVSNVVTQRRVDIGHLVGSVIAARPGHYNYIGEQETSGRCLEWARDHLVRDGLGVYGAERLTAATPAESEARLLDELAAVAGRTAPGAGGVIFTPWLHGNRSPFEDSHARGIFFNLGLETGKPELVRAVAEGVAMHKRWLLDCIAAKTRVQEPVRLAGGGALADPMCRIFADVTTRPIEAIENPRDVGAAGAAALCGVALGVVAGYEELHEAIPVRATYVPDAGARSTYDRSYAVFRSLHAACRRQFGALNARSG